MKAAGNGAHVCFNDIHMIARAGGWTGYAFILNNTHFDAYAETVYAGAASFEMLMGKVNLTGKSPSTGTFSATNGVATLPAAASWTNAPSVTVSGKGTLNVSSSGDSDEAAALRPGVIVDSHFTCPGVLRVGDLGSTVCIR